MATTPQRIHLILAVTTVFFSGSSGRNEPPHDACTIPLSSSLFSADTRFVEELRVLVAGDPSSVEFLEFIFISVLLNTTFPDKIGCDSSLYYGL